ncbi:MAG: ABC transporter ATP-binding protein [bacterium]|nr:ABC transporter ATP-binding protein [bacterium]
MSKKEILISIKNLRKDYVNEDVVTKVLHDITFNISAGEFVAIMGPSGSGKSTLMHILSFLDRLTSGQYLFKGVDTIKFDDNKLAELRNFDIGFIFQQFNLLPRTSVFENVKLPLTYTKKIKSSEKDSYVTKAINSVGLEHRIHNLSNQLSGGEKQRVAIARAIVNQPDIVFADEPTGNLDSKSGEQVMQILSQFNKEGKTVILVTHERYTAEYAERIINIRDGNIISDERVTQRHITGLKK